MRLVLVNDYEAKQNTSLASTAIFGGWYGLQNG
jgi:hypothetical protein